MANEITVTSLDEALRKIGCYIQNSEELLEQFRAKFIDPETGQIVKIDFATGVKLAQEFWDKFKEIAKECEGKEISVQLPGGILGLILGAALAAIGFRL